MPHALPFTMHTELLDEETIAYGLSVVDRLDEIRGKKTVSAKMTGVPGHTAANVPQLAKHGIKLLYIGVNGASAVPEVPKCFLWKIGGAEVVVVYSGDYGGAYKSEFVDEVLYFDHTLDNHGAPSPEAVQKKLADIQKEYPDYSVSAGTLDEFAEAIWAVKDKLPVLTGEIGDTWIHGSAADPYKSAALRTPMRLKRKWLKDGTMERDTDRETKRRTGYTTWYKYYGNVDERVVRRDLASIKALDVPFDCFQIDDGYQAAIGDWLCTDTKKFPSGMKSIADDIHAGGMIAGLWLAPFAATKKSKLFKEHTDWFIKDKNGKPYKTGHNWGGFYSLDIYNAGARQYLKDVFHTVLNDWGFDLVKLDFLYGACVLPMHNKSRGEIMCDAMDLLRECCGDKLILGCGVPMMPAFGKVDYCRIGSDISLKWQQRKDVIREEVSTPPRRMQFDFPPPFGRQSVEKRPRCIFTA